MEPPKAETPDQSTPASPEPPLAEDEEPVVTGTIFLTLILLMMIFGFWAMMYVELLNR